MITDDHTVFSSSPQNCVRFATLQKRAEKNATKHVGSSHESQLLIFAIAICILNNPLNWGRYAREWPGSNLVVFQEVALNLNRNPTFLNKMVVTIVTTKKMPERTYQQDKSWNKFSIYFWTQNRAKPWELHMSSVQNSCWLMIGLEVSWESHSFTKQYNPATLKVKQIGTCIINLESCTFFIWYHMIS